MKFGDWYEKNYKKLLVIPGVILVLSISYILLFYYQTGDVIRKDVSLTGGTSISILTEKSIDELNSLIRREISDFSTKSITDNSGRQIEIVVVTKEENTEKLKNILEKFLGEPLSQENSSIESTSASLSADFYRQLIIAIILAFYWMSAVVFTIFAKGKWLKFKVILINILFGFFLGSFFFSINPIVSGLIFLGFTFFLFRIYLKNSVPSFAVILSAFADMVMTLAVVDLIGVKVSTAGIVAFLMLIGYSVDTDILLTTRLLGKKESSNKALYAAFKTGTTMTVSSLVAVAAALVAVYSFSSVLNQIFSILLIGLSFDLLNTWITNASIIKWYVDTR